MRTDMNRYEPQNLRGMLFCDHPPPPQLTDGLPYSSLGAFSSLESLGVDRTIKTDQLGY